MPVIENGRPVPYDTGCVGGVAARSGVRTKQDHMAMTRAFVLWLSLGAAACLFPAVEPCEGG